MRETLELAPTERAELQRLEAVVERTLQTTAECVEALHEIKTRRLYREDHRTFGDYCRDRWNMSKSWGNELILEHRKKLADETGSTTFDAKGGARPEPAREVSIKSEKRPDTGHFSNQNENIPDFGPETKVEARKPRDLIGNEIDDPTVAEAFTYAWELDETARQVEACARRVAEIRTQPHGAMLPQETHDKLRDAARELKFYAPYAVSPKSPRGWLTETQWKQSGRHKG